MPAPQSTFLTGELNAPDLQTTAALNKIALGMPISNEEMMRITNRQKIEQQMLKRAGEWGITDPDVLARVVGQGGVSWKGQTPDQSILGAQPKYDREAAADRILRQRFGSFAPGQIRQSPTPQPTTPITYGAGQTTPRGNVLGEGESVTINPPTQPSNQQPIQAPVAPDSFAFQTQPVSQFGVLGQQPMAPAMPDVTPAVAAYTPQPMVQQPSYAAPAMGYAPQPQPYQPSQASQPSILGGTPVQQPSYTAPQPSIPMLGQYPATRSAMPMDSFSSALSQSPHGRALAVQEAQLQQARQKNLIDVAANQIASGNPQNTFRLPPELFTVAQNQASRMIAEQNKLNRIPFNEQALAAQIKEIQARHPGVPLTPKEQAEAYSNVSRQGQLTVEQLNAQERYKSMISGVDKIVERDVSLGEAARDAEPAVQGLTRLLSSGAVETGKGEEIKNSIRSLAKSVGFSLSPEDEKKLSNTNEAISYFNQLIVPYFQKTKGAITERENQLFASMGPQISKDAEANKRLLGVIAERSKTVRAIESLASKYRSGKIKPEDYADQRQAILDNYDKKIESGMSQYIIDPNAARAELEKRKAQKSVAP